MIVNNSNNYDNVPLHKNAAKKWIIQQWKNTIQ